MAVAAQGLTERRPSGRVDRRHLRKVFDRIGVIQIDSVNVLVRSQELPLFARLGPHPRTMLADALDDGELFEYWAHMAAIAPSSQHRLFRWRMDRAHQWHRVDGLRHRRPEFLDEVLDQVRDLGPITAADLGERVGKKGSWWDWDDGKIALEHLFYHGQVAARRRRNDFARLYDLPERVLPAEALAAPSPPEAEARKELLTIAGRALGVGHPQRPRRLPPPGHTAQCKPLVAELVDDGVLQPATVEGWGKPAYVHRDATLPRDVKGRALLSPFDSLVWNRERTERVFGFRYRIEIYTPPPKRIYGYYVLPFLLDGELVGRIDLKADRAAGVLRVQASHAEPGVDVAAVASNLAAELRSMADWLSSIGWRRRTAATWRRRCARPACH